MKSYLILFLVLLFFTPLVAQEQNIFEQWLSESLSDGEYIARSHELDDARQQAFGMLYDQKNDTLYHLEEESMLSILLSEDSAFAVNRRKAWIEAAVQQKWASEDTLFHQDTVAVTGEPFPVWFRLKTTQEEIEQFEDQLYNDCVKKGHEYLTRGNFCYEKGDLLAAAQEYGLGLSQLVPCLHRAMPSDMLVGEDLATYLYDKYLSVFRGIHLSALYEQVPVVKGEEIPVVLKFKVSVGDKPVINMPVQGWIGSGRMKVDERTDAQGYVSMKIAQAPSKEGVHAGIILHSDLSSMLNDNFARPTQAALLSAISEDAKTLLVPFDPTPTFYVSLDSLDRTHRDSLAVMLFRQSMVEVSDSASADVILCARYQGVRGTPTKHGNYMLTTTTSQLSIQVFERQTGHALASYAVPELSFSHPDSRSSDDVRRRTMELMMRQVSDEMPSLMKYVQYDKRKVVYGSVAK